MTEPRWLNETQQQAWRALLVLVNRGLPELDRTMKEHDLFIVHYSILVALSGTTNGTMRLSDLADAANVSQSRLTHRLRALTEHGDVVIHPDSEDRRVKNATLTASGLKRLESLAPLHVDDVQRIIFDQLDPEETEHFALALSKIAANLCTHERFLATDADAEQLNR